MNIQVDLEDVFSSLMEGKAPPDDYDTKMGNLIIGVIDLMKRELGG